MIQTYGFRKYIYIKDAIILLGSSLSETPRWSYSHKCSYNKETRVLKYEDDSKNYVTWESKIADSIHIRELGKCKRLGLITPEYVKLLKQFLKENEERLITKEIRSYSVLSAIPRYDRCNNLRQELSDKIKFYKELIK